MTAFRITFIDPTGERRQGDYSPKVPPYVGQLLSEEVDGQVTPWTVRSVDVADDLPDTINVVCERSETDQPHAPTITLE